MRPGSVTNKRSIVRLLSKIIASLLQNHAEKSNIFPQTQWGFRSNRSTVGALFVARIVIEMATEIGEVDKIRTPAIR